MSGAGSMRLLPKRKCAAQHTGRNTPTPNQRAASTHKRTSNQRTASTHKPTPNQCAASKAPLCESPKRGDSERNSPEGASEQKLGGQPKGWGPVTSTKESFVQVRIPNSRHFAQALASGMIQPRGAPARGNPRPSSRSPRRHERSFSFREATPTNK